jgi:ectoine hydroxylase-related dioxygenase (phytanoyl-CoA dioxygenase family)
VISAADIADYERDGAVCLRQAISPDWVDRVRAAIEFALTKSREAGAAKDYTVVRDLAISDANAADYMRRSPAAALAAAIMRSQSARFYFDQLFVKEPGTEKPTPWHQDQPYWAVSGRQICSIWLALDTISRESSGLEYVAGSHLWGKAYAPVPFTKTSPSNERMRHSCGEIPPDIDANRGAYRLLSWDMKPGDCLIHHGMTLHGSSFNATRDRRRRAFSTRWLGDDARYAEPQPYMDPGTIFSGGMVGGSMNFPSCPLIIAGAGLTR